MRRRRRRAWIQPGQEQGPSSSPSLCLPGPGPRPHMATARHLPWVDPAVARPWPREVWQQIAGPRGTRWMMRACVCDPVDSQLTTGRAPHASTHACRTISDVMWPRTRQSRMADAPPQVIERERGLWLAPFPSHGICPDSHAVISRLRKCSGRYLITRFAVAAHRNRCAARITAEPLSSTGRGPPARRRWTLPR